MHTTPTAPLCMYKQYVCCTMCVSAVLSTDQRAERARAQYLKEAGQGERRERGEQRQLTKDDFQIIKLISNGAYRWALIRKNAVLGHFCG